MKSHVGSLKKNQLVWALVEEVIAQGEIIINFSGDLLRVKNQTDKTLRAGQRVKLRVEEVLPLKLSLVPPTVQRETYPGAIDFSV